MSWTTYLTFLVVFLAVKCSTDDVSRIIKQRRDHKALELPSHKLTKLVDLTNLNHFNEVLDRILVSRVVGTETHDDVAAYIIAKMRELQWDVELDEFEADTPIFKNLKFTNIIATLNPKAERFLVLSAHYDSKYFKDEEFLGATDSAVPCAMMINLAHVMAGAFKNIKSKEDISIRLIFFDGEEAFKSWTATDSIYGARHLAEKWENEKSLHRIDLLVLLDLLGAPDPTIYNYFRETEYWYSRLVNAEERLDKQNHFESYQSTTSGTINRNPTRYFQSNSITAGIEDDHIPFLRRGVPVLHLIPVPFPDVWHKVSDDKEAVDVKTVENINKMLRIFIAEYLHIDVDDE